MVTRAEEITPAQFYQWQKTFFEQGAVAFARENTKAQAQVDQQIKQLQSKLKRKDWVIATLTEENIDFKKSTGDLCIRNG
jgi:transposase-like protein